MNKKKLLNKIRIGVEIEVENPDAEDSRKLIEKNRVIPGWKLDADGTLLNGGEYKSLNKNHLYYTEDTFDQIKEIIGLIRAHLGKVDTGCGLHCHVDMKNFTDKEIVNIVKAFYKQQKKILKKFKMYKNRESYACPLPVGCLRLTERMVKKIKSGSTSYGDDICEFFIDRHYAINIQSLNKYNTIEFRFFNGTLSIKKIKQAMKFAIEFCIKNCNK